MRSHVDISGSFHYYNHYNMAYHTTKNNWVTFEDGEEIMNKIHHQSIPKTIPDTDGFKSSNYLSSSLSSISSASSYNSISSMDTFCRGTSSMNTSPDNAKYQIDKNLHIPVRSDFSGSDSRYSVFSSVRESEKKGEYLGWSKVVLGEGVMGWSDELRVSHPV